MDWSDFGISLILAGLAIGAFVFGWACIRYLLDGALRWWRERWKVAPIDVQRGLVNYGRKNQVHDTQRAAREWQAAGGVWIDWEWPDSEPWHRQHDDGFARELGRFEAKIARDLRRAFSVPGTILGDVLEPINVEVTARMPRRAAGSTPRGSSA